MDPISISISNWTAKPIIWQFNMCTVSKAQWETWVHIWISLGLFTTMWLHCVSLMCCAAVVQLCSIQYCCLVTACWAGGRIKCCRCVWGNLWRAFEEGMSHSSWSSSRTESWTSHLLRVFLPTQYLALSNTDYTDSQSIKIQIAHLLSNLSPPVTLLLFLSSQSSFFLSVISLP